MGGDGVLDAVRRQLGLGRLLPLGGTAGRGYWLTERAARAALLRAVDVALPMARLDELRLAPADPAAQESQESQEPAEPVPGPPGALPSGPLRMTAAVAAYPALPLPELVRRLRATLAGVARERLGLDLVAVDVEVTELLGAAPEPTAPGREPPSPPDAFGSGGPGADAVTDAVVGVAGVRELSSALDGWLGAVRVTDEAEPPSRLVRLQLVVEGERALPAVLAEVGDAAARAAASSGGPAPGPARVAVLVTGIA
ncbi:nucleopolyhedrovirus P10 family protein [Streptomyces profundus]|uniref:nucleopolyhedrovirus P10 family protein n=1 Tax=Streptomyces profundus TaxID=2867410 RepID=UPI001D15E5D8|nr:nucleopolyhedrovirus P10 family protein [Streptomyces sp. MA3_2.13]UED83482.1 nucleopolyhedrovirus P10 family protein [Streptomyces sp. MA3_2.13]